MTKNKANKVAAHWNKYFQGSTDETKTQAYVEGIGSTYSVLIKNVGEKNSRTAFFHVEELAAMCLTFRLTSYVGAFGGEVYAVIS